MSAVSSSSQFPYTTLRVSITGENNLNCFYDRSLGRQQDVSPLPDKLGSSDYGKIAKAAGEAGIDRILIAGCEPLLRKDGPSIVKALCSSKKIQDVRFITNGIFLKDFADALRRGGLKHVEINLDSLNFMAYQKITKRDGLYRVLDGLQKAERIGFENFIVNVILMRGVNERELIDFAIMTKTRDIHVRFIEFNPNDDSAFNRQLHFPLVEAKRIIQDFQPMTVSPDNGGEAYRFKDGCGKVSFMDMRASYLNFTQPALTLNSQGFLYIDGPNGRNFNLLKELEKEGPDDKLQRLFQKVMTPSTTTSKINERSRATRSRSAQLQA